MSNATPDTRGTGGDRTGGDRRRRRSRGGKGRNRQRHEPQGESHDRRDRDSRQNSSHRSGQGHRSDRDRGPRPPRREPAPPKLTWWQKLLSFFGIKPKEAPRPPRQDREERRPRLNIDSSPHPGIGDQPAREPREGREPRSRDRGERGERDRDSRRNQERPEVASTRIYLGNLSYETSEEDLKDLFKGVGVVRRVEIIYNRRTHKSKGYGFVDMLNLDEAKRAVEVLHDQFFMGRRIIVSGAKSKEYDEAAAEERSSERDTPTQVRVAPLPAVAATVAATAATESVTPAADETAATAVEVTYSLENPEPIHRTEVTLTPEPLPETETVIETETVAETITVEETAPATPEAEATTTEPSETRTQDPS